MGSVFADKLKMKINIDDLPPLADAATRAMTLADREETTAKDLENVIRVDPALAIRVLRVANSPLFGAKVKTTTISHAVSRLGMVRLKRTLLLASVGEVFSPVNEHVRQLWDHALAVATASNWLSQQLSLGDPEECFIAGLLHDIGKVVLYRQSPEEYGKQIDAADGEGLRSYRFERSHEETVRHDEVGALVAGLWRLSRDTVETILLHHDVEENKEIVQSVRPDVCIVSVANLMAHRLGYGGRTCFVADPYNSLPARSLSLSREIVDQCSEDLPALLDLYADNLSVG